MLTYLTDSFNVIALSHHESKTLISFSPVLFSSLGVSSGRFNLSRDLYTPHVSALKLTDRNQLIL
jgi:hypothetical protein